MEWLKQNLDRLKTKTSSAEVLGLIEKNTGSLTLDDITTISNHFAISVQQLLFRPVIESEQKAKKIRFLILDVDGVMTDGGMYFSENGDQLKKYNTKDGMAIMGLTKMGFYVGIISSGFKTEMVKSRADLLNIQHFYVGRDPKIEILKTWCEQLSISLEEVAIIGDDINDLEVMKAVGLAVCPNDAVPLVKEQADIVLFSKGGAGCVREFIDHYLLDQPIGKKE